MDLADFGPRPRTMQCRRCKRSFPVKPLGNLPMYCSAACRQHVFRKRKAQPKLPPVTDDERHRRALWDALRDFGLVTGNMPPKPTSEDQ